MLTAIDVFSGAGGFSLGLRAAGIKTLAAFDAWHAAAETYELNFDHPCVEIDLNRISASDLFEKAALPTDARVDLVVGGPPCQGFSIQRIGVDEDGRNDLVLEFARLVAEIHPRLFIMENVLGLLGARGKRTLERFEAATATAGYAVTAHRVDASDWGVPQRRKRVLVIGTRSDVRPFVLRRPDRCAGRTVREAFDGLGPPAAPGSSGTDPLHVESRLSPLNRERLRHIPPGGGFEDLPVELRVRCHKMGADKIGHRNVYGRLHPDEPAVTITGRFDSFTRGKFAHPFEDRNITLREGARLQEFPDSFRFVGSREDIAALIGNAVPPRLAGDVLKQVADHLNGS